MARELDFKSETGAFVLQLQPLRFAEAHPVGPRRVRGAAGTPCLSARRARDHTHRKHTRIQPKTREQSVAVAAVAAR